MILNTKRLELVPLLPYQLRRWAEDLPALEQDQKCTYRAEPLEGLFLTIVKGQLEITEKNPDDYLWHSFWLLIRKTDRIVVGSADFKGIPDARQEVEIGYGLGKEFEHRGYMTEAVEALCQWALTQENVSHIIAETDIDSLASQRILQRCGFTEIKCEETTWWRL